MGRFLQGFRQKTRKAIKAFRRKRPKPDGGEQNAREGPLKQGRNFSRKKGLGKRKAIVKGTIKSTKIKKEDD